MLRMHRKIVRRTYQCDMPGCRNRINELNSRRADASSNPMHICDQCVIDLFRERGLSLGDPTAERGVLEVNGGLDAVVASNITVPPEEPAEPEPPEPEKPKEEEAPKAARKPAVGAKSGGKAKTGGRA